MSRIISCKCGQKNRVEADRESPVCGSCGAALDEDKFGTYMVGAGLGCCGITCLIFMAGILFKFSQWAFFH